MRESFFNTRIIKIGDCEIVVTLSDKTLNKKAVTRTHYHLHFELHFITGGNAIFYASDEDVIAKNKETVIIPPSVVHGVKDIGEVERFCITLLIKKTNNQDPDNTYENIFSRWDALESITVLKKSYEKELRKILYCIKKNNAIKSASLKHLLALLVLDLSDALPTLETQGSPKKGEMNEEFYRSTIIENCIDAYYQNPDANISLVADILHLSTKQAERTVKKLTGMSFKKLLLKQRMHLAKEMILTSDKKLYEIAQCVGYNSYEVFYKAFSKHFHIAPTKLKTEQRGETEYANIG